MQQFHGIDIGLFGQVLLEILPLAQERPSLLVQFEQGFVNGEENALRTLGGFRLRGVLLVIVDEDGERVENAREKNENEDQVRVERERAEATFGFRHVFRDQLQVEG